MDELLWYQSLTLQSYLPKHLNFLSGKVLTSLGLLKYRILSEYQQSINIGNYSSHRNDNAPIANNDTPSQPTLDTAVPSTTEPSRPLAISARASSSKSSRHQATGNDVTNPPDPDTPGPSTSILPGRSVGSRHSRASARSGISSRVSSRTGEQIPLQTLNENTVVNLVDQSPVHVDLKSQRNLDLEAPIKLDVESKVSDVKQPSVVSDVKQPSVDAVDKSKAR